LDNTLFEFHNDIKFECPSLIVGWDEEVGLIGSGVVRYLKDHLKSRLLAEIGPTDFFLLNGVSIQDSVARFPESKLYFCAEKELLLFESNSPYLEWYRFLNTLLDMAQFHCHITEVYTIGGMISMGHHTLERQLLGVVSSPEMKPILRGFNVDVTLNYETPDGQRPTLNSFLLWIAKQRNILGASMWVPVPFYLTSVADSQSWRKILEFFDERFSLNLDFNDLDQAINMQNEKLAKAREDVPELDEYLNKIEADQTLTQEQNTKLINDIEETFKKNQGIE
jgi:proteasome assembly chaperone (PAC2) family protein